MLLHYTLHGNFHRDFVTDNEVLLLVRPIIFDQFVFFFYYFISTFYSTEHIFREYTCMVISYRQDQTTDLKVFFQKTAVHEVRISFNYLSCITFFMIKMYTFFYF